MLQADTMASKVKLELWVDLCWKREKRWEEEDLEEEGRCSSAGVFGGAGRFRRDAANLCLTWH